MRGAAAVPLSGKELDNVENLNQRSKLGRGGADRRGGAWI